MRRREFIAALGVTALAWPVGALGQASGNKKLIAWLSGTTPNIGSVYLDSFLQGMRDLGYVEGRQFDMVTRFSGGYQDRIASQTAEVVGLKPDVIVATAAINVIAVKKLTSTIPIVSGALADAVDLGLIASDARPGGNVTGIEPYIAGLPAKQMEIAREIVAGASKIGILTNLSDPKAPPQVRELEAAARGLEVKVVTADASRPDAIATAMGKLADERVDVVIVLQTSMLLSENRLISASAIERRLPTVCGYREHVLSGGLISYGVDLRWCFNRTAYFVDKILRGTPPGDLPVEFPSKLLLSINLKTARALDLTVSPALINFADEVIE